MDTIVKEHRSWNMSRIKSKNTSPELSVRKALTVKGFRYRLHAKGLPGKPDVVLKKYKTVIFINGCFWHQHEGCKKKSMPKSNIDYWDTKLKKNVERQNRDIVLLKALGWNPIKIWECQTRQKDTLEYIINDSAFFK